MSEDAHNPDGSPPSFVPTEVRAEYWEKRARHAEGHLEVLWKELTNTRRPTVTEEERMQAERLADEYSQVCWCAGPTCSGCEANTRKLTLKTYAAACEAKRAEVHKHKTAAAVFREMIDAERARSAKLLEALDYFAHDGQDNHVAQNAIAEYEADRD